MTANLSAKALYHKKKSQLTTLERQQIVDLERAYGKNNIISAIRFAESAQIKDVAKMLLQHCGFRENLLPSVNGLIPNRTSAEKSYSFEKYRVGCRLAEATAPIKYELEKNTKTLLSLWRSRVGLNVDPTNAVQYAVKSALRRFGFPLAQMGIQILPMRTNKTEEQLIELYKLWLAYASVRDRPAIKQLFDELGTHLDAYEMKIPEPMSPRLEKYFIAKANCPPTPGEKGWLWSMMEKYKLDEVLHAMSCVTSREFCVDRIEEVLRSMDNSDTGLLEEDEDPDDATFGEDGAVDDYLYDEEIHVRQATRGDEFYDYSTFDEDALDSDEIMGLS